MKSRVLYFGRGTRDSWNSHFCGGTNEIGDRLAECPVEGRIRDYGIQRRDTQPELEGSGNSEADAEP